jgi:hypothetical protein
MWNGYPYHADCIGEAVAQTRAASEQRLGTIESFEEEFPYGIDENNFDDDFDEFADYENEEIVREIEEYHDVSDDVLTQIPISAGNGSVPEVIAENNRREVHINDVVQTVSNQFAADCSNRNNNVGTLISGRKTTLINRSALRHLPVLEATATFQPIPHHQLVE